MTQQLQPPSLRVPTVASRRRQIIAARRRLATGLVIGGLVLGGGPAMLATAFGEAYRNPFVPDHPAPSPNIRQTGYGGSSPSETVHAAPAQVASARLGQPVATGEASDHNRPPAIAVQAGPPRAAFEPFLPGRADGGRASWSDASPNAHPKRLPRISPSTATVSARISSTANLPTGPRTDETRPDGPRTVGPNAHANTPDGRPREPNRPRETVRPREFPDVYLASQTATTLLRTAREHRQRAELEYSCRAYASAEASCWQAFRSVAQAIDAGGGPGSSQRAATDSSARFDVAPRETAVRSLEKGHAAINEASDFVGPYAGDQLAVARLARAHATPVIRQTLPAIAETSLAGTNLPTATEAIDRYLDYARGQLAVLASASPDAAAVMDLLAAIRLDRADATQLPGPTALCLRRAAVQGQSQNPTLAKRLGLQLAAAGLTHEARWALSRSLELNDDAEVRRRLAELSDHRAAPSTRLVTRPDSLARAEIETFPVHDRTSRATASSTSAPTRRTPEVVSLPPEEFAAISQSVIRSTPKSAPQSGGGDVSRPRAAGGVPAQAVSFRQKSGNRGVTSDSEPAPSAAEASDDRRFGSRFFSLFKKWW